MEKIKKWECRGCQNDAPCVTYLQVCPLTCPCSKDANLKWEEAREKICLDQHKEVIDYMNTVCGTSFRPGSKTTQRHIGARLKEGFTVKDLKRVIVFKFGQWKNDPKMSEYLRPETLFGTKFEGYLQASKAVNLEEPKPVLSPFELWKTKNGGLDSTLCDSEGIYRWLRQEWIRIFGNTDFDGIKLPEPSYMTDIYYRDVWQVINGAVDKKVAFQGVINGL